MNINSLSKSIFISLFPLIAFISFTISVISVFNRGFSYANLGLILMSLPIILFFASIFIFKKARTDRNLMTYTSIIIIGAVISISQFIIKNLSYGDIITTISLSLGWLAYLRWYSIFENRNDNILKLGNKLPYFVLEDLTSKEIESTSFIGVKTLWLFYRGNWCPLCMAQIKELAAEYKELESMGVKMILVSPQPHKHTSTLARKHDVKFQYLIDKENKVAKQLGIYGENGVPFGFQVFGYDSDTVLPTVVIADEKANIIFSDLTDNYRIRPEPSTFIQALKAHS